MKEIIQIEHLTRDYGNDKGIFDLTFSVGQGQAFGFLGPNGAGKTTTLRHLMGFLRPQVGSSSIENLDCWQNASQVQSRVGYLPGEMNFPPGMTGLGFLEFYAAYRGMKGMGRRQELMERFDLDAGGQVKKMSKGMKQKVGIIAAFMHDPDVLLLDEPTSGLDPLMQNEFIKLILEEKQRGKTILMSSHMFEEVERTCDRVGIIRQGRMVAIETVEGLKAHQVKRYIVTFENPLAANQFAQGKFASQVDGNRVVVTVKNDLSDLLQTLATSPVTDLSAPVQSLEDIFLTYYGNSSHQEVNAGGESR